MNKDDGRSTASDTIANGVSLEGEDFRQFVLSVKAMLRHLEFSSTE